MTPFLPNSNILKLQVEPASAGKRLDQWLAKTGDLSRNQVQKAIREGRVFCHEKRVQRANQKISPEEIYKIHILEFTPTHAEPQKMALDIVFEDDYLLVLNKPAGLVVHPGAGNPDQTLINGLLAHCDQNLSHVNGMHRPGIVHRLDKDTTGLLIVAKQDTVHQALQKQFQMRTIRRVYYALVWGEINPSIGEVERGIMRHPRHPQKMVTSNSPKARYALTNFRVIRHFKENKRGLCSLITCQLATGRTHQIRVHLTYIGHPLVGDQLYGRKRQGGKSLVKTALATFPRQALHASSLGFTHPITEKQMHFEVALPNDFEVLLKQLYPEDSQ